MTRTKTTEPEGYGTRPTLTIMDGEPYSTASRLPSAEPSSCSRSPLTHSLSREHAAKLQTFQWVPLTGSSASRRSRPTRNEVLIDAPPGP